jgi:CheY-like chemotaxis protein
MNPIPENCKRVLIVDDEESFTRMVKRNLERNMQYMVRVVNDSTEALKAAREFHPDIIFLDIIMPGADGGDVAIQLRADPVLQKTPIVFVSAMVSRQESAGGFYTSGGELFIAKPVDIVTLIRCIETHTAESK